MSTMVERFQIGLNYMFGDDGYEQDGQKALEIFEELIREGGQYHAYAGLIYYYGYAPVRQDREMARRYYEADQTDSSCVYWLAVYYADGNGGEPDLKKAFQLYQQAAQMGHRSACEDLGMAYLEAKGTCADYDLAAYWLQKAYHYGRKNLEFPLAKAIILSSEPTAEEIDLAEQLLTGLDQNFKKYGASRYYLGEIYRQGLGGRTADLAKAAECYQIAARRKNNPGLYRLSLLYRDGEGVDQDPRQAFTYMQQAADRGYSMAIALLGRYYLEGIGVEPDYARAVELSQRYPNLRASKNTLAACYREGKGIEQDMERALSLYNETGDKAMADVYRELYQAADSDTRREMPMRYANAAKLVEQQDEEYSMSRHLLCPCCGSIIHEDWSEGLIRCPDCKTVMRKALSRDERFLKQYNLSHKLRQAEKIDEAIAEAERLASDYPDAPEALFTRLLARRGVQYVGGSLLIHINRYTEDPVFFDADLTRIQTLTSGQEMAAYYRLAYLIEGTRHRYEADIRDYRLDRVQPVQICLSPRDELAAIYADELMQAFRKNPTGADLICPVVRAGFDVYQECVIAPALDQAALMVVIASEKQYVRDVESLCRRFLKTGDGAYEDVKRIWTVSIGGNSHFKSLTGQIPDFTDTTPKEEILEALNAPILNYLRGYSFSVDPTVSESVLRNRINETRKVLGMQILPVDPQHKIREARVHPLTLDPGSGEYREEASTCYLYYEPNGHFRVCLELPHFHSRTVVSCSIHIYDMQDELIHYAQSELEFFRNISVYQVTFDMSLPDGSPRYVPGYYYAILQAEGYGSVSLPFYMAPPVREATGRRLGKIMGLEPEAALEEFARRQYYAAHLFQMDMEYESIRRLFGKGPDRTSHAAVRMPDGTVRSIGDEACPPEKLATSSWRAVRQILCVQSGTIGLTQDGELLYAGTSNRLARQLSKIHHADEIKAAGDYIFIRCEAEVKKLGPQGCLFCPGDFSSGFEIDTVRKQSGKNDTYLDYVPVQPHALGAYARDSYQTPVTGVLNNSPHYSSSTVLHRMGDYILDMQGRLYKQQILAPPVLLAEGVLWFGSIGYGTGLHSNIIAMKFDYTVFLADGEDSLGVIDLMTSN